MNYGYAGLGINTYEQWEVQRAAAEKSLQQLGLVSRQPIEAEDVYQFRDEYIEKRNLIAWNFYHPEDASRLVDIIISYDLGKRGRKILQTAGGPIHVLGIRDLIGMKRESGRPQDLADIEALEQLL